MEQNFILSIRCLTKQYGKNLPPALNNVSLRLCSGRIVGLLGPNGSGKTTLIKLLNGLLTPNSGEIYIDGNPVGIETKKVVAYLPDRDFLPQGMSVNGALDYYGDFFADFSRDRALSMLSRLGIDTSAKIKTLSKGNREKVSLILTMSRDAKLYLLDEPIAGVDPATRDYILNTIITNRAPDSTVMISTHLIADVEQVLDDVIFIKNGTIEMFRSAAEVRETEGKSVDELFREVYRW